MPELANLGSISSQSSQIGYSRSTLAGFAPEVTQVALRIGEVSPELAKVASNWSKCRKTWPNSPSTGRNRPHIGRIRSTLAELAPELAKFDPSQPLFRSYIDRRIQVEVRACETPHAPSGEIANPILWNEPGPAGDYPLFRVIIVVRMTAITTIIAATRVMMDILSKTTPPSFGTISEMMFFVASKRLMSNRPGTSEAFAASAMSTSETAPAACSLSTCDA